jgi:hypothetical protein
MFATYCTNVLNNSDILILHENFNFGRDLQKRLRTRGFVPRSFHRQVFSAFNPSVGQQITLVIDINMQDRHLRFLQRILRARAVEARFFFVNAMGYQKSDWRKIEIYCEMIALKHRLAKAADTELAS